MIITADGSVSKSEESEFLTHGGIKCFWVGFIYSPGLRAGKDTMAFVAEHFERTGSVPFGKLRGAFSAYLISDQRILAFADNSDLSTVFVHEEAVGDRFLPLLQHLREQRYALALDPRAVAQTYSIGRVLSGQTLISSVVMLDKQMYLEISEGKILTRDKGIPDIDSAPREFTPSAFFDALAEALPGDATSCALTGGYDSRLVYSYLRNRMNVRPSLSGDIPASAEAKVSAQVAEASGSHLNFVSTPKPDIDAQLIERLFEEQDGAPGFSSDSGIRLFEYYEGLRTQGYEMHITGDGGVLHKDWEWIQDFPFYHRKHTNLGRFYDHRLGFNFDSRGAGSFIDSVLENMRQQTLENLKRHLRRTNTQSYDMLYYHVNGRRTVYYNAHPHGIRLYAPLLERDFVAYSYDLPRFQRFFNNSIRSMTSAEQPDLARIPTVYGMTASSKFLYVCRDVFFQLIDYSRRAIRMVGRKVLKRTPLMNPVVTWSVEEDLRTLPLTFEAVEYCREMRVVTTSESVSSLSRPHLDAAIQIFLVSRAAGLTFPLPDSNSQLRNPAA